MKHITIEEWLEIGFHILQAKGQDTVTVEAAISDDAEYEGKTLEIVLKIKDTPEVEDDQGNAD